MKSRPPKSSLEIQIEHFAPVLICLSVPRFLFEINPGLETNVSVLTAAEVHTIARVALGVTGLVLLSDLPRSQKMTIEVSLSGSFVPQIAKLWGSYFK